MRRRAPILLAAVGLALASAARADAPEDDAARYAMIRAALGDGAGSARLWWYGWSAGYSALTIGQVVLAATSHDYVTRVGAWVGAAGTLVGAGATLLSARAAFDAPSRLDAMDAATPEARRARLHEAERLLDEAADDELLARSVWAQLGADAVTLAGTFVLWAGYRQAKNGWVNLVGGVALGEGQILTKPTAAIAARRRYLRGELASPARAPAVTWTFRPALLGGSLEAAF